MEAVNLNGKPPSDKLKKVLELIEKKLEAGKLELPMLPQVAQQVLLLTMQASTDAQKLSGLIHRDPALAGHVLRIANSPAYAPRMPIVSLQQATARIGMQTISEIAMAASLGSRIFKVPGFEDELNTMFQHSLSSGLWSKEIARERRHNVESAFLCGLLHDIGKPVALQATVDSAKRAKAELQAFEVWFIVNEMSVRIGASVGEKWGLPASVVDTIRFVYDYDNSEEFRETAMMANGAHQLASWSLDPEGIERETVKSAKVFPEMNLYPEDVEQLLERAEHVAKLMEAMES